MRKKWALMGICVLFALSFAACVRTPASNALDNSINLEEFSSLTGLTESEPNASAAERVSSEQEVTVPSLDTIASAPLQSSSSASVQLQSSSSQPAVSSAVTTSAEAVLSSTESEPMATVSSQEQSVSSVPSVVPEPDKQITVTLTIYGVGGELMVDAGGIQAREGSTVFTVLRDYAKQTGLELIYSGGTKSAYVEGIGGLYAFDYGSQSGWLYRVNGDFDSASVSCGSYPVYDGDCIEWLYTTDDGADVGAPRF